MSEAQHFAHSHLVTDVFGHWPQFHDAEVLRFAMARTSTGVEIEADLLTIRFPTKSYDDPRHDIVKLRFTDIEDLELSGFNGQNVIASLMAQPKGARLVIQFCPCYGIGATFSCSVAEVFSCTPVEDGPWLSSGSAPV